MCEAERVAGEDLIESMQLRVDRIFHIVVEGREGEEKFTDKTHSLRNMVIYSVRFVLNLELCENHACV